MNKRVFAQTLSGIAILAIAISFRTMIASADYTIYSDEFNGGLNPLHGTTPDIAFSSDPFLDLSWNASQFTFFEDGTLNADPENPVNPDRGGGGAYLPFNPDGGRVYTLSADINNLQSSWVGFGFVENPYTQYIDDDSGRQEQAANGTQWFQVYPGSASFMSGKSTALPTNDPPGTRIASVGGLTGTNSLEITLDTNDINAVWVGASINGTPMDLDPDSGAFKYNAGPLASMGTDQTGIQGLGFSVRGIDANHTRLDGLDNLLLTSTGELPPVLELEVNTGSGEMTIHGNGSSDDIINSYQITSELNQLDPSGWVSLEDQGYLTSSGIAGDFNSDDQVDSVDLSDPVDGWKARFGDDLDGSDFLDWQRNLGSSGSSTGWEEGGEVGPKFLGEAILTGDSTIALDASINLGTTYTGPAEGDLKFVYRTADGSFVGGNVTYAGPAVAAVPEPSSWTLLAMVLLGLVASGCRQVKAYC